MSNTGQMCYKVVGHYVIDKMIGKGAFSEVYQGFDLKNSRNFVERELIASRLLKNCYHVVEFYDCIKTTNNYYYIYELCNGGNLLMLIGKKGHIQEQKAIEYFKQILKGYQSLISKKIVHRDLKPQNILIKNQKLKIADFGLCKILNPNQDIMKSVVGTLLYQSPQITYGTTYTYKSDIYSLGVILYKMLFGVQPYKGQYYFEIIEQLSNKQLIFPQNIPVSFSTKLILKRMLEKTQQKRAGWNQIKSYFFPQFKDKDAKVNKKKISSQNIVVENEKKQNEKVVDKPQERQKTETVVSWGQYQSASTVPTNTSEQSNNSSQANLKIQDLLNLHGQVIKITQILLDSGIRPKILDNFCIIKACIIIMRDKLNKVIQNIKNKPQFAQIATMLIQNIEFLQRQFKIPSKMSWQREKIKYSQIKNKIIKIVENILMNISQQPTSRNILSLAYKLMEFTGENSIGSCHRGQKIYMREQKDMDNEQLKNQLYGFII